MSEQRAIVTLLLKYSESHLNPTNEAIHCVCVPLIVFSLLGMIWAIHPLLAIAGVIASLIYYFKLSRNFALG